MNGSNNINRTNTQSSPEPEELDLSELLGLLRRKAWLVVLGAVLGFGAAFLASLVMTPVYEADVQVLISEGETTVTMPDSPMALLTGGGSGGASLANRMQIIKSPVVLEPALSELAENGQIWEYRRLYESLQIQPVNDTDVIEISVEAQDPVRAKSAAEAVLESYRDYSDRQAQDQSHRMKEFLESQVEQAETRVQNAQKAIREFQQDSGIIYLTSEEQKLSELVTELERQLIETEIRLHDKTMQLAHTQDELELARQLLPEADTVGIDKMVEELQQVQAELKAKRAEYIARGLEGSPEIEQLDRQIDGMSQQIQAELSSAAEQAEDPRGTFPYYRQLVLNQIELQAVVDGLKNQTDLLEERIGEHEEELWRLSDRAFEYAALEREVEVANNAYALLSEELEHAKIALEQDRAALDVISPAVLPEDPVRPRPRLNAAIGLVLGLFVSTGLVFAAEYMDNTVKDRRQLRTLGISVLGTIPRCKEALKQSGAFLVNGNFRSHPVGMAFIRIESSLRLAHGEERPRVLACTSAVSDEGKSTVAFNLGRAMAQSGHRVLLVDGTMGQPGLGHAVETAKAPGLAAVLAEQADWQSAVQNVEDGPDGRVDLIAGGESSSSAIQSVRSPVFKDTLQQARSRYDQVIIDLPPLLVSPESLEAAAASDGVLLVVESKSTPVDVLQEALEQLEQAGVPVWGAVLNKHAPKTTG